MKSVQAKPATSAVDERCSPRLRVDEFHDNLMMTIRITAGREVEKTMPVLILNINNASWHLTIYLLLVWRQHRSDDRSASCPADTISGNNALHSAGNISCLCTFF